jgi:NADH dehydrogenase
MNEQKQIVVVGAGFAGLQAAKLLAARATNARIVLVDRHNHHTFTPLLYQVATSALDAVEIAYPIRSLFRRHRNVDIRVTEVTGVDLDAQAIQTAAGPIQYDYLLLAAGSTTNFYNTPGAQRFAFGLKDLHEASDLRTHLLSQVEKAAEERDPERRRQLLTVVVVGGGPTGVELAGAITELIRRMIARDFPMLDPNEVHVLLVEAGTRLLAAFRSSLSNFADRYFNRNEVEVRLHTAVTGVTETGVVLASGDTVATPTVVWAAGVRARQLLSATEPAPAPGGRLPVRETLQLEEWPNVYVAGDMAAFHQSGALLPMLAPVAMQEGSHAARNILEQLAGRSPRPFHYVDRGTMATLGRSNAVAQIGPISLTGYVAWLAWLALHLVELIGFGNRLLVLMNWVWDYTFFDRGARVIVSPEQQQRT